MKSLILILLASSVSMASDFKPYVGLNMGGTQLTGVNSESNKTGYLMGVKGLGSWSLDSVVLDAGVGYYFQEVSSQSSWIKTKTATLDLDARYKLNDSYQVGVGTRSDFGTDNSGKEYIDSNSQSNLLFAKMVVQDEWKKMPFRYEFGVGKSMGQARDTMTAFAGIQISLPESNTVKSAPRMVKDEPVKVDLKMAKIYFETDKFIITEESEKKITELAKFLVKNNTKWSRIKIGGHTDVRGDNKENKTLSQDRADAVLKILVQNGVDESKLAALGYGSKVPASNESTDDGLQKNRRTEIEFFGVENRVVFNNDVIKVLVNK
jgi:outer membrane protein OmpA-like peptidoglycan-associated protein